MKKLAYILILLFIVKTATAQEFFIPRGKITFEKSINQKRTYEGNDWYPSDFIDNIATYRKSNWEYQFTETHSLFSEGAKNMSTGEMIYFGGSNNNQMYTNFASSNRIFNKAISGVDYLLKDTIPKLDWKVLPEVRTIAGYETRKATAVFNDTVTVVAFYTDQIIPQGGPEGFTGLPGMILGLAIPRYFTTWFATKVEVLPESSLKISPPSKGEKAENEKDFNKMLEIYARWYNAANKPTPEEIKRTIYGLTL